MDTSLPIRKPLRLSAYNYSQPGPYFVTMCIHHKQCLLGAILSDRVQLTAAGRIVHSCWMGLPKRFAGLLLDEFVVMPNHFHGILAITRISTSALRPPVGEGLAPPVGVSNAPAQAECKNITYTLPDVIGAFKSISTIEVNRLLRRRGLSLWQRGYYEHIIRNART